MDSWAERKKVHSCWSVHVQNCTKGHKCTIISSSQQTRIQVAGARTSQHQHSARCPRLFPSLSEAKTVLHKFQALPVLSTYSSMIIRGHIEDDIIDDFDSSNMAGASQKLSQTLSCFTSFALALPAAEMLSPVANVVPPSRVFNEACLDPIQTELHSVVSPASTPSSSCSVLPFFFFFFYSMCHHLTNYPTHFVNSLIVSYFLPLQAL